LLDDAMEDEMAVTVIATGFDPKKDEDRPPRPEPQRARQEAIAFDLPDFNTPLRESAPKAKTKPVASKIAPVIAEPPKSESPKTPEITTEDVLDNVYPPARVLARDPFAEEPELTDVDRDHDTVIGMLVDKFQRERSKRNTI